MDSSSQDNLVPENHLPDQNRRRIFLAFYALLTIFVVGLTIFLSIRALSPQPQTIPTFIPATVSTPSITPSPSPSPTQTSTATSRPTFTPKPSRTATLTQTPTVSPTSTLPPSLTPAFPDPENQDYSLVEWTPELADRLIQLMQAYPRTLSAFARGEDNAGFYEAFIYAIFAQREALMRFPSANQADGWFWNLAIDLARTGDPQAGTTFANLITNELNRGSIDLTDLESFGNQMDPEMQIELTTLEPSPGVMSSNIIKVSIADSGAAIFWLLERQNGYRAFPLTSQFDFIHPTSVDFFIGDITGDGEPEIIIYRSLLPGAQVYELPRIFRLGIQPPEELFFQPIEPPKISPDFQVHWEPIKAANEDGDLQFIVTLFPACPVTIRHTYEWDGNSFRFLAAHYTVNPDKRLLNFCEIVPNHAIQTWGPGPTIQIMETILPLWPPERTTEGNPYPQDALDEWRFRLGIYHALDGNISRAKQYLEGITTNPATPNSRWISPANQFLEAYQNQRDIYRACLTTDFCDPRHALQAVVATFTIDDYANALQELNQAGLLIRSSGFFDFDQDGTTERWFILRVTELAKPEFWILAKDSDHVKALFVDHIDENQPRITIVDPGQEPPIIQIGRETTFVFQSGDLGPQLRTVEPIRVFSVDLTQEQLEAIEADLLAGEDPTEMRQQLLDLEGSSFFTCNLNICPKFQYMLGLANELSGNRAGAVDAYLEVWDQFPRNPFTTMARFKLEGLIPTPTPTLSPTPTTTPTPVFSMTPTISPTLSVFATTTITGTPPATVVPTATQEGYPAPPQFPTPTPGSGYP